MDIRLDDPADLAMRPIHIKPVALKSLNEAGYRRLCGLRWVPDREQLSRVVPLMEVCRVADVRR